MPEVQNIRLFPLFQVILCPVCGHNGLAACLYCGGKGHTI